MAIDVELFGQLAPTVQRRQTLTLESPMSVSDVAEWMGVLPEEVGLIIIDGVQHWMSDTVPLNCRLCFFPPMVGG